MLIKSLITARGNSKSISEKNIIKVNKNPLIYYSIFASINSYVDETWVSTDNLKIKKISLNIGAKVIDRPKELATDYALNESALIHFADNEQFDWLVFIQPTSPLIKAEYINQGIDMIKSGSYDSVFSVTEKHWVPTWSKDIKPINWDINNRPRRQDKDEFYEENGMFYIISKERLLNTNLRYGGKMGVVKIPLCDSFQIDNNEDLQLIKKIIS